MMINKELYKCNYIIDLGEDRNIAVFSLTFFLSHSSLSFPPPHPFGHLINFVERGREMFSLLILIPFLPEISQS